MSIARARRRVLAALLLPLTTTALGLVAMIGLAAPASAAPPTYVVAGDAAASTGEEWGLHEAYFSELRSILTDTANFGPNGRVRASFTIGSPRAVPLTPNSLNGLDVYFLSARDLVSSDITELTRFRNAGGAIVVNSNAPSFFDTTAWLGLTLSDRVVFGDGPAPYNVTHRATTPSQVVASQTNHPILNGPFGTVASFDNWHSVAGFLNNPPSGGSVLARTTLTGASDDTGSGTPRTITGVGTLAAFPAKAFGAGSGPVIATSDVDTYGNAYLTRPGALSGDSANTLTGSGNGTLARNSFAWLADQLAALRGQSTFVSLASPVRALDTRGGTPFNPGATRNLSFTAAGVPSDATMVALNITAVDPTATGFLSAFPAGGTTPNVSSLNFRAGTTVANAAFVRLGANGEISILNSAGNTHVLVDVIGYSSPSGSRLVNVAPTRIKDTRSGLGGSGVAAANTTQNLRVTGGVVPNGATGVILNVTAVDPTATAFVTVWPADQTRPTVSNINTVAGTTVPNLVVVRLPTSGASAGTISLYNAAGDTHLLVDVLGYFTTASGSGSVTGATPTRVYDTRAGANPLVAQETRTVSTGVFGSTAVIVNITAVDPSATGFLTVFPGDGTRPESSNVNFYAGRTSPNLVVVTPAADGTIKVYNSAGTTQLLVDVVGRFDA